MSASFSNDTYLALSAGLSINGGSGKACALATVPVLAPCSITTKTSISVTWISMTSRSVWVAGMFSRGRNFRIDALDYWQCGPIICIDNTTTSGLQDFAATPTPEPTSLLLLGTGLLAIGGTLRRKLLLMRHTGRPITSNVSVSGVAWSVAGRGWRETRGAGDGTPAPSGERWYRRPTGDAQLNVSPQPRTTRRTSMKNLSGRLPWCSRFSRGATIGCNSPSPTTLFAMFLLLLVATSLPAVAGTVNMQFTGVSGHSYAGPPPTRMTSKSTEVPTNG